MLLKGFPPSLSRVSPSFRRVISVVSSAAVIMVIEVTSLAVASMPVIAVPAVAWPLISAMMVVIVLVKVAMTTLAGLILLQVITLCRTAQLLHALLETYIVLEQLLHLNLPHVVHLFKKKKKKWVMTLNASEHILEMTQSVKKKKN